MSQKCGYRNRDLVFATYYAFSKTVRAPAMDPEKGEWDKTMEFTEGVFVFGEEGGYVFAGIPKGEEHEHFFLLESIKDLKLAKILPYKEAPRRPAPGQYLN